MPRTRSRTMPRRKGRGVKQINPAIVDAAVRYGPHVARAAGRLAGRAVGHVRRNWKSYMAGGVGGSVAGAGTGTRRKFVGKPVEVNPKMSGASGQYETSKFNFGKKVSALKQLAVLDKKTIQYELWEAHGVNNFNATTGYQFLWNLTDNTGSLRSYFPLHITDLTAGGPTSPTTWYMYTNAAAPSQIEFGQIQHQRPDNNSLTPYYFVVKGPSGTTTAPPNTQKLGRTLLDYVSIDLLLRGIRSRPTCFTIQIVQLKDEALHPDVTANDERSGFWEKQIRPLINNPILKRVDGYDRTNKLKVLKTWKFHFDPDESNNLDTVPTQRRVNLFYRCNKYCNWMERGASPTSADAMKNTDDTNIITAGATGLIDAQTNAGRIDYNDRLYLIIKASAYDIGTDPASATDQALMPQYDYNYRVKHVYRQPMYGTFT